MKLLINSTYQKLFGRFFLRNPITYKAVLVAKPFSAPASKASLQNTVPYIDKSLDKMMSEYIIPNTTKIAVMECEEAFNGLTEKEKFYAHYMGKASWYGHLIAAVQNSPESPLVFALVNKIFQLQSVEDFKNSALQQGLASAEDLTSFLMYAGTILCEFGNYKSDGNRKFIPNLPQETFRALLESSQFAKQDPEYFTSLLSRCLHSIYSLKENEKRSGFSDEGTTTYLSKNITRADNDIVNKFLTENNYEVFNSRLFKTVNDSGQVCYEIRLASVLPTESTEERGFVGSTTVNNHKFIVTRGDFSTILSHICLNLQKSLEYAANETEVKMIEKLISSFRTGSLKDHKDATRFWIKNKNPIVESHLGFIETYQDPAGVRGQFEGFVVVVNKALSVKYEQLVNSAEKFLPLLPWNEDFEKDKFTMPDYTSVDILAFSGWVPAGCCLPNYDEIRQNEGFKNLTFANCIQAAISYSTDEKANYISHEDSELIKKHGIPVFYFHVGLHELLGHGSGKLFIQESDGTFNFDIDSVIDFETNSKISSWYKSGETYSSVFGDYNNPLEECRAECVGVYLSTVPEIAKIFGYDGDEAEVAMYVNWLSMALSGLKALQSYEAKTDTFLQSHDWGRHVILRVFLDAGEDFLKIEPCTGEDGKPDLLLTLDRSKIMTVGKKSIGDFLRKLQLYKSIANKQAAVTLFKKYSTLKTEDCPYPFTEYRKIVIERTKPRKHKIMSNTFLQDGKVMLKRYDPSVDGLIKSFTDRFQDVDVENLLEEIWKKDQAHFY